MHTALPALYLISSAARIGEDAFIARAAAAVRAGLEMIVVREPGWSPPRRREFLRRLDRELPRGVFLILGHHPDAGEEPPLAGVESPRIRGLHLGRCSTGEIASARRDLPAGGLIGYSAHSAEEAAEAFAQGADYVSFSPVFEPLSKPSSLAPHGIEGLRRACSAVSGPLFALGGITAPRAREARAAGAHGVAVIGAITGAADPAEATRGLLESLR
ncbi:MAG: thiamine phosphate synthase [Planctomycetes bacterium]|nr:thiamine phosphate synthase [Planctomycetota bacterium]